MNNKRLSIRDRPNYLKYYSELFISKNLVRLEFRRVRKELEREGRFSKSYSRFIELHNDVKYNNSFKKWEADQSITAGIKFHMHVKYDSQKLHTLIFFKHFQEKTVWGIRVNTVYFKKNHCRMHLHFEICSSVIQQSLWLVMNYIFNKVLNNTFQRPKKEKL